jgi:hypothetical protein
MRRKRLLVVHRKSTSETRTTSVGENRSILSGRFWQARFAVALLASSAIAQAQSDKLQIKTTNATSQPEICDTQNPADQHSLSTKSGNGAAAVEGADTAYMNSTSLMQPLRLPGVQDAGAALDGQVAQCKPDAKEAPRQSQPTDPADSTNRPVFPQPDPTAPTVSYSDGELKVVGHGARLGQILETIKALTGITLDLPPDGADIQIFDDVGPAPVRKALIQLLDGSRLNYVILGSSETPQRVRQLILTAQTSTTPASTPGSANGSPVEQAKGPTLYGEGFGEVSPQPEPVQPALNPVAIANAIPVNVNIQKEAAASGKTPGQILDELQKKQLQQLDDQLGPQ